MYLIFIYDSILLANSTHKKYQITMKLAEVDIVSWE